MIYGATGFTGRLIAAQAVTAGLRPILAGRNPKAVQTLSRNLELPWRAFDLGDEKAPHSLADIDLVLNCAGPFSHTAPHLGQLCVRSKTHYVDIGGELQGLEALQALHQQAQSSQVALVGAAGLAVLPTDCMTRMLLPGLPDASRLTVAIQYSDHPEASLLGSILRALLGMKHGIMVGPGSVATALESLRNRPVLRQDSHLCQVPWASRLLQRPIFHHGPALGVIFPWGDVICAAHSHSIPNVEAYLAVHRWELMVMKCLNLVQPLLRPKILEWLLQRAARHQYAVHFHEGARSTFWIRLENATGKGVQGRMTHTPSSALAGYDLTVYGSLAVVKHMLGKEIPGGFTTGAGVAGSDIWRSIPGLQWHGEEPAHRL